MRFQVRYDGPFATPELLATSQKSCAAPIVLRMSELAQADIMEAFQLYAADLSLRTQHIPVVCIIYTL